MKIIFRFFVFCFLFAGFLSLATKLNQKIEILSFSPGLQYDYKLPKAYKNKKIKLEGTYGRYVSAIYRKSKNDIRFNPRRAGQGVLVIKDKNSKILKQISIDVNRVNLHKVAAEIRDLLLAVDGIEVKILNNRVVIDGEILLPRDMDRIQSVVKKAQYKNVVSLVTFSPKAQNQIANIIEKEIGYTEPPNIVTVKAAYNRYILEGDVANEKAKERAGIIADLYTQFDTSLQGQEVKKKSLRSILNLIQVRPRKVEDKRTKLIQIVVHYVELQKNFNKGFSFQWAPAIDDGTSVTIQAGGAGGVAQLTSVLTSTIGNFFPKLNWAKSFNFARVLHSSTLLLQDNKQGSIDANTSIPIAQSGAQGTITTIQTTSRVKTVVKPKVIGPKEDTISMEVLFEVASPTGSTQSGEALTSSRVIKTHIHVGTGRTAALGGLISSSLLRNYNRLPAQAPNTTPIINLFSAKNYDTSKSQFVVFITPTIKSSASVGVKRIMNKFRLENN